MNRFHFLMTTLGFLAASATGFAQAPDFANVPFDFQAGSTKLTAGEYRFDRGIVPGAILISTANKQHAMVVATGAPKETKTGRSVLVFHKYGNHYLLAEVWFEDELVGHPLQIGRAERELRASTNRSPEIVYIAVNHGAARSKTGNG